MTRAEIVTAVRRKVGEQDVSNTKWSPTELITTIDEVLRRLHYDVAEANPEFFRTTLDVVLPADTEEVDIGWTPVGAPTIHGPVYDITDSADPGKIVQVVPRHIKTIDGVGINNNTFYITPNTCSTERTFRIVIAGVYADLSGDSSEPDFLPPDLQYDLAVYGTAIDLQDEEPEEVPQIWLARYQEAKTKLLRFARNQTKDQAARYGEQYMSRQSYNRGRRNHVL